MTLPRANGGRGSHVLFPGSPQGASWAAAFAYRILCSAVSSRSCINVDETFMGLKLMRRWLMRQAEVRLAPLHALHVQRSNGPPPRPCGALTHHPSIPSSNRVQGDVLEVSAGTGRNLPYYPLDRLRSLTLTDTSRPMLVNAADKLREMTRGEAPPTRVRFELADAQRLVARGSAGSGGDSAGSSSSSRDARSGSSSGGEEGAHAPGTPRQAGEPHAAEAAPARPALRELQTFPPHSFDVVVDTFGLCSQRDPVTALKVGSGACWPG